VRYHSTLAESIDPSSIRGSCRPSGVTAIPGAASGVLAEIEQVRAALDARQLAVYALRLSADQSRTNGSCDLFDALS